jgi:hypothetical protein
MVELRRGRKVLQNIKKKWTKNEFLHQISAVGADCAGGCVCRACASNMV